MMEVRAFVDVAGRPDNAAAGNAPVMPLRVKRGEKLIIVPPVLAAEIMRR